MDTGVEGLRVATKGILEEIHVMNGVLIKMSLMLDSRLKDICDELQKIPKQV